MKRMILILILVPVLQLTVPAQNTEPLITPSGNNQQVETKAESDQEAEMIEAIKKGDIVRVLELLDLGVSPDATDKDRSPALCWAVRMNRADIAEVLLARKATVDKEDDREGTALQIAVTAGRADLVRLLIGHKADVNHKDDGGHTVLMMASFSATYKNVPEWVLKKLFDDDLATKFASMGDDHIDAIKLLLAAGADANAQAEDCGLTPLMIAAMSGKVELGRILLAAGAKVDLGGEDFSALKFAEMGETPEDLAHIIDDETNEEGRQAILNWLQFTRAGRKEFATMLRKAGATK